jgi:hypothetical protein
MSSFICSRRVIAIDADDGGTDAELSNLIRSTSSDGPCG